jgi:hypothetical protein
MASPVLPQFHSVTEKFGRNSDSSLAWCVFGTNGLVVEVARVRMLLSVDKGEDLAACRYGRV